MKLADKKYSRTFLQFFDIAGIKSYNITQKKKTASKMSKYGVFSWSYFLAFGLNTEIYRVNLGIQYECRKLRSRKKFSIWALFTQ